MKTITPRAKFVEIIKNAPRGVQVVDCILHNKLGYAA